MLLRAITLATWIATTCAAQEADRVRLPAVLHVLDAERLDGRAFEELIEGGAQTSAILMSAYSAPAADDEVRARRRARALRALRAIGADARNAADALIDALHDAERDEVPDLLDTLSETVALGPDPDQLLGDATAAFTPFVTPGDPGFIDRLKGAIRLHMRLSRPLPADDIGALMTALQDDDPYLRELAAVRLGALGPAARRALDALENTIQDDDHPRRSGLPKHSLGTDFATMIRAAASVAIARIAPQDPRASTGLRALLTADSPRERIEAAMAIGRAGDHRAEAALIRTLDDDDVRLVAEAVTALGMIDASSSRAVSALQNLLGHPEPSIAARARAALKRAGVTVPERR